MTTEKEILKHLKNKKTKEKGFSLLVENFSKPLYFQIKKITKNHEDTNDVLQNTFIKAWRYIDKFKQESKLSTWLYTIAKNETYSFLKNKHRKNQANLSSEALEIVFNELKAEEYIDSSTIKSRLLAAINTLPAKQKQVFALRYFNELKYADIAKQLNASESSLKSSYHFAVKKIEKFLTTD